MADTRSPLPKFDAEAYARTASAAMGLDLDDPEIAEAAVQLGRMAELMTAIDDAGPLPLEPAPTFVP